MAWDCLRERTRVSDLGHPTAKVTPLLNSSSRSRSSIRQRHSGFHMRILAVTCLAFVAAALASSAYIVAGFGEVKAKAFTVVLFMPLLWAALMVWAYWDTKAWRPAVSYASITAVSLIAIFMADPLT